MIIKPKTRGFICTTAHPVGCAKNVRRQIDYAKQRAITGGPRRVLVIGSSTGYGLACRITAAFGCHADTVGVYLERASSGARTATAGYYNSEAFDRMAEEAGLVTESINGDAFSTQTKTDTIDAIRQKLDGGQVDLVIYSLAAPRRTDPVSGESYASVLKPIGRTFTGKTVDFHSGTVSQVEIEPADENEIDATVKVMGGEDWLLWMQALQEAGVLAQGVKTVAFSYIGPSLTHAVYKDGTIGRAKMDLEAKAAEIGSLLSAQGGQAFVAVNKAVVTQASSAIPVVPLYISLLFRFMKEKGTHEDCIEQMVRMFTDRLYRADAAGVPVDEAGRIRMDDWEMDPAIQEQVLRIWQEVDSQNIDSLSDLAGYRQNFYHLFGFGVEGVDYEADVAEY